MGLISRLKDILFTPNLPSSEKRNKIVILGGSGVNEMPQFADLPWKKIYTGIETDFHDGWVEYQENGDLIFIKRHGVETAYGPALTNYKANLVAAKLLGAKAVIATSACGSFYPEQEGLEERIAEGSLVVVGDIIDDTKESCSMFGKGFVSHAQPKPTPFYQELSDILHNVALEYEDKFNGVRKGKVYVSIPGDNFGTVAEGRKRKNDGAHIVGMTIAQESIIALQLDLPYAAVAFPVDYDINANHVNQTLKWFKFYSEKERIPDYLTSVVEKLRDFRPKPQYEKISGNLIPQRFDKMPKALRQIALDLTTTYPSPT